MSLASGVATLFRNIPSLTFALVLLATAAADATPAPAVVDELLPIPEGDSVTLKLWLMRAEQGSAAAQFTVGYLYAMGRGAKQDYVEAGKWFRRAGAQGHGRALFSVGLLYENGWGVPEDQAEALRWYRLAAEKDEPAAQTNIAYYYYNGLGVPRDYAEAFKWYRLAALHGLNEAQSGLAGMYEHGVGVAEDHLRAFMWYGLAVSTGDPQAEIGRHRVAEKLSKEEIAQGGMMARRCLESNFTQCD